MGLVLRSRLVRSLLVALALLVFGGLGSIASATDSAAVIPDTGFDMAATVTAAAAYVGTIIGVCVGVFFAFVGIRIAMRWARKALAG